MRLRAWGTRSIRNRRTIATGVAVPLVLLAGCSGHTTPPKDVTQTSANLQATVSCSSGENCRMYFKWGLADGTLNQQTPTTNPVAGPVTDAKVNWPINGLQPGKTYAYQVCGQAQAGQPFFCAGPDGLNNSKQEFTTLPNCTQTLAVGANITTALQSAAAGAVICLSPGTHAVSGSPAIVSANGTAAAPVTLTSADPQNPATIHGRFVTHTPTKYLTIRHLRFTWNSSLAQTAMVLAGTNVTLLHNDISGGGETICLNTSNSDGSHALTSSTIDHNRIHDCGNPNDPNPDIGAGDRGHAQGVYTNPGSTDLTISNNWCYRVAARCYQERFGVDNEWHHNLADYENWGYHFGDGNPAANTPRNNSMTWNISGPHHYRYTSSGFYHGGDLSVFGGGTNETFSNNCWQGETNGPLGNVTMSGNVVATPQFVDAPNGDFHLKMDSPCADYGPRGSTPGP
jgi:hypothetical protein